MKNINNTEQDLSVLRVELELINKCNLNCPLCARNINMSIDDKKNPSMLSLENIQSLPKLFPNLKFVTIAGPTSEPTLHPDLIKIVSKLFEFGYTIELFINGSLPLKNGKPDTNLTKKLALLFKENSGRLLYTICGSTQELHQKYRKGSNLDEVMANVDEAMKYNPNTILTWIIFEYNQEDYNQNHHKYSKYNLESFYTLPVKEFYNTNSKINLDKYTGINLIPELSKIYNTLDINKMIPKESFNLLCKSKRNGFRLIDSKGDIYLCSLNKYFGFKKCHECHPDNLNILRNAKINTLAESEDESSELIFQLQEGMK